MKKKIKLGEIIFHGIMILFALLCIFPFVWTLCTSFKTTGQIYNESPLNLIPKPFTLDNYKRTWEMLPFTAFLRNSIFISTLVPALMILFSSMAAYAFAKLHFKGKNIIFLAILATMMVPGHVTLIPNYSIVRALHWIDKYAAIMIPPLFTGVNAFNIFFFRQYFLSIPKELEDAATIDGCSRFKMFFIIIIPNSKPAIATVSILSFRSIWNSFLWPSIVMNTYEKMTITVGLKYFQGVVSNWGELLAGTTVALIPILIVFLIFQKYFIQTSLDSGFGGK